MNQLFETVKNSSFQNQMLKDEYAKILEERLRRFVTKALRDANYKILYARYRGFSSARLLEFGPNDRFERDGIVFLVRGPKEGAAIMFDVLGTSDSGLQFFTALGVVPALTRIRERLAPFTVEHEYDPVARVNRIVVKLPPVDGAEIATASAGGRGRGRRNDDEIHED